MRIMPHSWKNTPTTDTVSTLKIMWKKKIGRYLR